MQVLTAQKALAQLPCSHYIAHSRSYRTPPLGGMNQPSYINSVSHLRCSLPAEDLLYELQSIELLQGRRREESLWQARSLDLDLLIYGDDRITSDHLTVPHYDIAQRNFVIFPLLELAPNIIIPGIGRAADIAASLNRDDLVPVTAREMAMLSSVKPND